MMLVFADRGRGVSGPAQSVWRFVMKAVLRSLMVLGVVLAVGGWAVGCGGAAAEQKADPMPTESVEQPATEAPMGDDAAGDAADDGAGDAAAGDDAAGDEGGMGEGGE